MRILLTLAALLVSMAVKADLPYMPLYFELRTTQESYLEGERVEFVLTITNVDTSKAYPVLLPHTQNTGQKLVYLHVYDSYQKAFIQRAYEDRQISRIVHDTGMVKKIMLGPREKISIPFYWNDVNTQAALHHQLNIPLFAGEYWVIAYYNPQGIAAGDSLYHFIRTTHDAQSPGKLNFWMGGMPATCMLKIRKAPVGPLRIQGVDYDCRERDKGHSGSYLYYLPHDSLQYVHFAEVKMDDYRITGREYHHDRASGVAEFISRYPNGNIEKYWKYGSICPTEIYKREFDSTGTVVFEADRWPDGSVKRVTYYSDRRIKLEEVFTPGGKTLTTTEYLYKQDKTLLRKKVTTRQDACLVMLLELKE